MENDITILKGARFLLTINLQEEDVSGNVSAFDATGLALRGQARRTFKSTEAFEFSFNAIDLSIGRVEMIMDALVTETLPTGNMVYDVEVYDPNDTTVVYKALRGNVTVIDEVTRV